MFALLALVACGPKAPDYPAVGECPPLTDKAANWCDGKVTTVGVVLQVPMDPPAPGFSVYFQDLEQVDPVNRSPYNYYGLCYRCFLVDGQAYRARLTKEGLLYSILVDGRELIAGVPYNETDPIFSGITWDSAGRSSVTQRYVCSERGGHWESQHLDSGATLPLCVPGKDTRTWSLAGPTEQASLPACNEHGPYANRTFHIVITVTPGGGMSWTFDEAPAEVAHVLLFDLNQNGSGLVFDEASGVASDLDVAVTLTQIVEGTQRCTAEASVTGFGEGFLFSMTSGDNPFTSCRDAIAALASGMRGYFSDGWNNKRPCVKRDRSILR